MQKKRLYIVSKNPFLNETKNNARIRLEKFTSVNVLCFDSVTRKKDTYVSKIKDFFQKNFAVEIDKIDIFNQSDLADFNQNTLEYNVFYFPRIAKYNYYKKLFNKNNIIEEEHELIIEKKFSPVSFVIKKRDCYFKIFTIDRSDDESIYLKFEDSYTVKACERDINHTGIINLKPILKKVHSPYISYHPSGVIHSNDSSGLPFIEDLRSLTIDYISNNNFLFPMVTVLPSLHRINLLKNIGIPPLANGDFNFISLGDNFLYEKIIGNLNKPTFVCVDVDFLLPNEFISFELWIHKNEADMNIFNYLDDWQKKNAFNCITFNNKDSRIHFSIILRRVSTEAEKENEKQFAVICTLGSISEFLAYSLELQ